MLGFNYSHGALNQDSNFGARWDPPSLGLTFWNLGGRIEQSFQGLSPDPWGLACLGFLTEELATWQCHTWVTPGQLLRNLGLPERELTMFHRY